MQCNYTNPYFGYPGCNNDSFSFGKGCPYPQIIGEGDVTSMILPDGSVQLYFVPAKQCNSRLQFNSNFPYPNNFNCIPNSDVWFVRSISHPVSPCFFNRTIPNVYGDQLTPPSPNPNLYLSSPPSAYYQKFHNDNCTSTTDIHYFCPSSRRERILRYSAEIQTDPLPANNDRTEIRHFHCRCQSSVTEMKKSKLGDASGSSTSYMSIDSTSKSKRKLNKRHKKNRKRSKAKKTRDHYCGCSEETKGKSDKLITTYADSACGCDATDGRHTQTARKTSKRSDIKTEVWVPVHNGKSGSSLKICSSESCYSGKCCCDSASDIYCN